MKKVLMIIAVMIGSFVAIQAQQEKQAEPKKDLQELNPDTNLYEDENGELIETTKPIFQFTEEVHDFGELEEGPKYDTEFTFTNIGKEPLIITGVKASCGCTTPNWPKEPVMPGDEATIKVTYNTKGRLNKFNKAVTITSNAITPTKRLYIKGSVKAAEGDQPTKAKKPMIMEQGDK